MSPRTSCIMCYVSISRQFKIVSFHENLNVSIEWILLPNGHGANNGVFKVMAITYMTSKPQTK